MVIRRYIRKFVGEVVTGINQGVEDANKRAPQDNTLLGFAEKPKELKTSEVSDNVKEALSKSILNSQELVSVMRTPNMCLGLASTVSFQDLLVLEEFFQNDSLLKTLSPILQLKPAKNSYSKSFEETISLFKNGLRFAKLLNSNNEDGYVFRQIYKAISKETSIKELSISDVFGYVTEVLESKNNTYPKNIREIKDLQGEEIPKDKMGTLLKEFRQACDDSLNALFDVDMFCLNSGSFAASAFNWAKDKALGTPKALLGIGKKLTHRSLYELQNLATEVAKNSPLRIEMAPWLKELGKFNVFNSLFDLRIKLHNKAVERTKAKERE